MCRTFLKSQIEKDLEEVVAPGGVEAFVFDTVFWKEIVFQEAQCGAAEQAEGRSRVAFAEAGLIHLERRVQLPDEHGREGGIVVGESFGG